MRAKFQKCFPLSQFIETFAKTIIMSSSKRRRIAVDKDDTDPDNSQPDIPSNSRAERLARLAAERRSQRQALSVTNQPRPRQAPTTSTVFPGDDAYDTSDIAGMRPIIHTNDDDNDDDYSEDNDMDYTQNLFLVRMHD